MAPRLPRGSTDDPTLARRLVQARESIDEADCHGARHHHLQKITSASPRGRAQPTRLSYIRDVQPHQSTVTLSTVLPRHARVRRNYAAPFVGRCMSALPCAGCRA
ncbi:hypothetical protein CPBF426_37810 [Xanthomonas arboricola pv. juglandis]|nr:hypothetical protein [Xanthomonas euroxanthea]SYZ54926.1 hypothetical protein CPBF367_24140 [Xanthomonas arboricola pv. juglandis]SYZ57002.1 hypothetical protein CPBF426_37810 [Xanthomonas arboricola pv. juglandis]